MTTPKKPLESMTNEELILEMKELHKKLNYQPEELKINEKGVIVLNPQNDNDKKWMEELED